MSIGKSARIVRTNGRNNPIDTRFAATRAEALKYCLPAGNFTDFEPEYLAEVFGCKSSQIRRVEYGAGRDKLIGTFYNGLQKEIMLVSLQPELVTVSKPVGDFVPGQRIVKTLADYCKIPYEKPADKNVIYNQ